MIISDLDYLHSIPEADIIHLNGGDAVATGTGSASADGKATYTRIIGQIKTNSKSGVSWASSYVNSTAASSGGSSTAYASSGSFAG